MAITKIIGFQQYQDYLDISFVDFDGFGNLPIYQNKRRYYSNFVFRSVEDRVWLSAEGRNIGTSSYQEAARHPSCKVSFTDVYPDHLGGAYTKFMMGFRIKIPNTGNARPVELVWLNYRDADIQDQELSLVNRSEVESSPNVEFFIEVRVDLETRQVRRWIDGVEFEPKTLPDHFLNEEVANWHFHFNTKQENYWDYQNFYLNDLYFLVDTTQDNDGLPSNRLGPVKVKALTPQNVIVPASWTVPPETDPVDLVTESIRDPVMRDVPALATDSTGESAKVQFQEPDVGEGKVLYTELEVYGYRNFGDGVQLHTKTHLGTQEGPEKVFELEPERLKVGPDAIRPGSLHKALDGEEWTQEKLANLELEIWTTKIE